MSKKFPATIDQYLRSYSAYVKYWDEEAGDSDQLLSLREWLEFNSSIMDSSETSEMVSIDDEVLALSKTHAAKGSWDAVMLKQTAELIRQSRQERIAA